ncbi:ABC transporter permease [Corynebacterium camporealensis]|uniref:ABC transporter permease n=1 Tax=Corynebacterium camporealensis TaxID=161896 RepID=UPI0034CEF249
MYSTLVRTLWRSQRREPVGLFFQFAFAPMMVLLLGLIFGNDAQAEFGGMTMLEATLPGFASLCLAVTGLLQMPLTLITLRESGALQRLRLTPMHPGAFMAANLTVHFLVALAGMLCALTLGVVVFGVELPENPVGVLGTCVVGLAAFLALGYLLASIFPSVGAATGIGNVLMIVMMMTSGAFGPLSAMPQLMQDIIEFSPLRWFIRPTQELWYDGSLGDTWPQLIALIVLLVVCAVLGQKLFRWSPKS